MVKTVNTTQEANHLSRECLERRLLRIYHGMYTGDVKSEINTIDIQNWIQILFFNLKRETLH